MGNRNPDENGWQGSAAAWIARMADRRDFAREHVLDRIMLERASACAPGRALDVGCGEGRFCRMLSARGIDAVGLDPVPEMIAEAKRQDENGAYHIGFAEELTFGDASFDLVISYLSLIDIDDAGRAISQMARVLAPGGHILIANLTSFATSSAAVGPKVCKETNTVFRPLGSYLEERVDWYAWDGLRIRNWHRPLSAYMRWFLNAGLTLTHFDEPEPQDASTEQMEDYRAMPYLMIMEWQKPR